MEDHLNLIQQAEKAFTTADHLCYVTLPLLKEPKLMITITQNLDSALTNAIQALLNHDHLHKQLQEIPKDFEKQLILFENKIMPKYKISKDVLKTIKDVKNIMKQHKSSAVEFTRKEKYFVCDDKYKMKTLDAEQLKVFVFNTRPLIQLLRGL